MRRRTSFAMMLAFMAMLAISLLTFGAGKAHAQSSPPGPCPFFWVNYNYVYPPAPNGEFDVQVRCADGRILPNPATNEMFDGHYTYPADPTCLPIEVIVTDRSGIACIYPIAPPGAPQNPPVFCLTSWGSLKIEAKFDSNGCLEIKLSY